LVALALDRTKGNTSGDALAGALEGMKPYAGTTGTFKFSATDHNGLGADAVKMCELHGTWNVIE
jgi:ABC-type branched-subunit amino acid transport system substrate-binding protein